MTTLEQTLSLISTLSPEELLEVKKYIRELHAQDDEDEQVAYDYENTPEFRKAFPKLTKEQFFEQLAESKRQFDAGEGQDAFEMLEELSKEYGL